MANVPSYSPLLTRDTDLAFDSEAPLTGDIRSALADAGFRDDLSGDDKPPVTRYTLGDEDAGFYAEFLTPLRGTGVKRHGDPDATVSRAGITAQKLRHLDLLLVEPWLVTVGPDQGVPLGKATQLLVTNPVSFIVQKLLIHKQRKPGKPAQDLLYIHDTIDLFGGALPTLRALWANSIRPTLPAKTARSVPALSADTFATVTDVIREAVRIPTDRLLSPERLRAVCQFALNQVLDV